MIPYHDTWPETPRLLWRLRHAPLVYGPNRGNRSCPSCGHAYWPGHFRDHLRSVAHRENRGWWR